MAKQTFTSGQVLTAAQMTTLQANDFNLTVSTKTSNYTLVASDAGTRVVGNAASLIFTVNNSVFTAGDTLTFDNRDSTVLTIAAGAGVTINSASGLTLAQYQTAELYCLSASSFVLAKTDVTASAGALTFISATSIGSTVSSVTVSSAFSSTFANYVITLTGGTGSAGSAPIGMQLGSTTTGYYQGRLRLPFSSSSPAQNNVNNGSSWSDSVFRMDSTGAGNGYLVLMGPNLAQRTVFYASTVADPSGGDGYVMTGGTETSTTQHTAFTLTPTSGTITGGVIRVYGLANS
jgi:hypothetical protein